MIAIFPRSSRRIVRAGSFACVCLLSLGVALPPGRGRAAGEEPNVTLVKGVDAVPFVPKEHAADILGIGLGMRAEAVRAILAREFGAEAVKEETTFLVRTTREGLFPLKTQTYLAVLTAERKPQVTGKPGEVSDSDGVEVFFGGPATGDVVVRVRRTLGLEQSRPVAEDVVKDLLAKYGPTQFYRGPDGSLYNPKISWAYGRTGRAECSGLPGCRSFSVDKTSLYGANAVEEYKQQVKAGREVLISAEIHSDFRDNARVSFMTITLDDYNSRLLAVKEMQRQFDAAIAAAGERATSAPREGKASPVPRL